MTRSTQHELTFSEQTMEGEIMKEALELTRSKNCCCLELAQTGRFHLKPLAEALRVERSNLVEQLEPATARRSGFGPYPDDEWLR